MSVVPSIYFRVSPFSHDNTCMARKLVIRKTANMGRSILHAITRLYFTVIINDVTEASSPDRVVASP